jgi:hypothetical protein
MESKTDRLNDSLFASTNHALLPDIPELQHQVLKNFLDLLFLHPLHFEGNDPGVGIGTGKYAEGNEIAAIHGDGFGDFGELARPIRDRSGDSDRLLAGSHKLK